MNIAIIGGLFVLFIVFLVLIWKAAKDWRWYNLVATVITMILAITFLFPTANALKSRAAWHKIKESNEARAETVVADTRALKYGSNDPAAGPGVLELSRQLSKLGIEAGRRWRGLQMANTNDVKTIQLRQPPAQAAAAPGVPAGAAAPAPAPAAPAQPLIPVGLVVYGFSESLIQGANPPLPPLPTFFLGEFQVTASTPTGATLTPTGPLEDNQSKRITEGQAGSWSVYELLPLDAHTPFIAEGSAADDDYIFGRVDENLIRGLLQWTPQDDAALSDFKQRLKDAPQPDPEVVFNEAEQKQYLDLSVRGKTFQDYQRDGSRSNTDDPPLSRWLKIEFQQNYTIDVDSPQKAEALEGGFFDDSGRAVDSRLQRGEDGSVRFKVGDRVEIKEEAANDLNLVGAGKPARLIDTYYVRPLNDYRFVLRRIRLRLTEMSIRTEELTYEQEVLNAAIAATVAMLTTNQNEKLALEQDLAQYQAETKAIREYHDRLAAEVKKTRQTLVSLFEDNQRREQQLRKAHSAVLNSAE